MLCAAQQISNEVLQPASITLTGDLSCAEHKFLNRVEQNIEAKVNDKVSQIRLNVCCELLCPPPPPANFLQRTLGPFFFSSVLVKVKTEVRSDRVTLSTVNGFSFNKPNDGNKTFNKEQSYRRRPDIQMEYHNSRWYGTVKLQASTRMRNYSCTKARKTMMDKDVVSHFQFLIFPTLPRCQLQGCKNIIGFDTASLLCIIQNHLLQCLSTFSLRLLILGERVTDGFPCPDVVQSELSW